MANPVQPLIFSLECFVEFWSWESMGPEPKGLFLLYKGWCQLFILMLGLKNNMWTNP